MSSSKKTPVSFVSTGTANAAPTAGEMLGHMKMANELVKDASDKKKRKRGRGDAGFETESLSLSKKSCDAIAEQSCEKPIIEFYPQLVMAGRFFDRISYGGIHKEPRNFLYESRLLSTACSSFRFPDKMLPACRFEAGNSDFQCLGYLYVKAPLVGAYSCEVMYNFDRNGVVPSNDPVYRQPCVLCIRFLNTVQAHCHTMYVDKEAGVDAKMMTLAPNVMVPPFYNPVCEGGYRQDCLLSFLPPNGVDRRLPLGIVAFNKKHYVPEAVGNGGWRLNQSCLAYRPGVDGIVLDAFKDDPQSTAVSSVDQKFINETNKPIRTPMHASSLSGELDCLGESEPLSVVSSRLLRANENQPDNNIFYYPINVTYAQLAALYDRARVLMCKETWHVPEAIDHLVVCRAVAARLLFLHRRARVFASVAPSETSSRELYDLTRLIDAHIPFVQYAQKLVREFEDGVLEKGALEQCLTVSGMCRAKMCPDAQLTSELIPHEKSLPDLGHLIFHVWNIAQKIPKRLRRADGTMRISELDVAKHIGKGIPRKCMARWITPSFQALAHNDPDNTGALILMLFQVMLTGNIARPFSYNAPAPALVPIMRKIEISEWTVDDCIHFFSRPCNSQALLAVIRWYAMLIMTDPMRVVLQMENYSLEQIERMSYVSMAALSRPISYETLFSITHPDDSRFLDTRSSIVSNNCVKQMRTSMLKVINNYNKKIPALNEAIAALTNSLEIVRLCGGSAHAGIVKGNIEQMKERRAELLASGRTKGDPDIKRLNSVIAKLRNIQKRGVSKKEVAKLTKKLEKAQSIRDWIIKRTEWSGLFPLINGEVVCPRGSPSGRRAGSGTSSGISRTSDSGASSDAGEAEKKRKRSNVTGKRYVFIDPYNLSSLIMHDAYDTVIVKPTGFWDTPDTLWRSILSGPKIPPSLRSQKRQRAGGASSGKKRKKPNIDEELGIAPFLSSIMDSDTTAARRSKTQMARASKMPVEYYDAVEGGNLNLNMVGMSPADQRVVVDIVRTTDTKGIVNKTSLRSLINQLSIEGLGKLRLLADAQKRFHDVQLVPIPKEFAVGGAFPPFGVMFCHRCGVVSTTVNARAKSKSKASSAACKLTRDIGSDSAAVSRAEAAHFNSQLSDKDILKLLMWNRTTPKLYTRAVTSFFDVDVNPYPDVLCMYCEGQSAHLLQLCGYVVYAKMDVSDAETIPITACRVCGVLSMMDERCTVDGFPICAKCFSKYKAAELANDVCYTGHTIHANCTNRYVFQAISEDGVCKIYTSCSEHYHMHMKESSALLSIDAYRILLEGKGATRRKKTHASWEEKNVKKIQYIMKSRKNKMK